MTVHKLPPLILHPFADSGGPDKLVESSRANLMIQGLLPAGEHRMEDIERTLLDGRFCEIRMLFYVGKDLLRWMSSRKVFERWFVSQKGFSIPAAREWSKHPVWNEDPIMAPFRDVILTARAPGWPGPSDRKAAETVSKYIITDLYAKAVQGMPAEDAVKWAHAELVKIYA